MPNKKTPNRDVFINCPFDSDYLDMFRAIVFAARACNFYPRSAKDTQNGARVRIATILDLIEACDWGIHDLSAVELDQSTHVPRFNMPLELGMAIGAIYFGGPRQRIKRLLILEREPHRYDASISDISGQDIEAHRGDLAQAIKAVRNWLSSHGRESATTLPGGQALADDYILVRQEIDTLIAAGRLDPWDEMTHQDYLGCLDAALKILADRRVGR